MNDQWIPAVPSPIYTLRAVVKGVSPMIWRHLLTPSQFTMTALHDVLQLAFGWTHAHLFRFRIHGKDFGSMEHDPGSAGGPARTRTAPVRIPSS